MFCTSMVRANVRMVTSSARALCSRLAASFTEPPAWYRASLDGTPPKRTAREAAVDVIRYRSVRDPRKGINLALLGCRAFARPEPTAFQTWRVYVRDVGVQAICEAPRLRIAFDRDSFAADPRIAKLKWQPR